MQRLGDQCLGVLAAVRVWCPRTQSLGVESVKVSVFGGLGHYAFGVLGFRACRPGGLEATGGGGGQNLKSKCCIRLIADLPSSSRSENNTLYSQPYSQFLNTMGQQKQDQTLNPTGNCSICVVPGVNSGGQSARR